MSCWRITILSAACLLACGCQTGQQLRTELLERELRMQEDCIFELEYELETYEKRLEACRRENEALRREKGQPSGGGSSSSNDDYYGPPTVIAPPAVSAPAVESDIPFVPLPDTGPLDEAPPYQGPPAVDPIDPAAPPMTDAAYFPNSPVGEQTPLKRLQFLMQSQVEEPVETDFHITGITLNRMLTGGYDLDNRFGDEGVMVVVEPRNAAGRVINVPAQVSVVLLDPALPPPSARVARWDFTADEAANHFRTTRMVKGMQFQLPWPDTLPTQQDLHLHVRVIMTDGNEFRADRPVTIDIPGRPSHRWTTSARAGEHAPRGDALGHEYGRPEHEFAGAPTPARMEMAALESDESPHDEDEPVQQVSTTARYDAAPPPPESIDALADGLMLAEEAEPLGQTGEPRRLELERGAAAPRALKPESTTAGRGAAWSPYR